MPSAAALRIEIEHALERRFPAALTPVPRTIRETAPTGIPQATAQCKMAHEMEVLVGHLKLEDCAAC